MKEERVGVVPCTIPDDYRDTIKLIKSAQGYRMIGVEWLAEQHPWADRWEDHHHLLVAVAPKKLVHYTFVVGRHGSNTLCHVNVEDISFEEALLKYTKLVCDNGLATLVVMPM